MNAEHNLYIFIAMVAIDKLENAEWLELFSRETGSDYNQSLCSTLHSNELVEKFWRGCSELYYLSIYPTESEIEKWKDVPEIYDIIKGFIDWAEWFCLELLIWKYNDEIMEQAKEQVEEMKRVYEGDWWILKMIGDPKSYGYMVWYFWGSWWREAQYLIKELRSKFPEKVREIKHK